MTFSIKNIGISITAKSHNPSIVTKEWLSRKKIIQEKEIKDFASTPVFSFIETDDIRLMIDDTYLEISVKKTDSETISKMLENIKKYVKELPETPYSELKFRFLYKVSSNLKSLKELFEKNEKLFTKIFPKNYEIGGIIEFNYGKFVINVTIVPIDSTIETYFRCGKKLKAYKELQQGLEDFFDVEKQIEKVLEGLF